MTCRVPDQETVEVAAVQEHDRAHDAQGRDTLRVGCSRFQTFAHGRGQTRTIVAHRDSNHTWLPRAETQISAVAGVCRTTLSSRLLTTCSSWV